MASLGYNELDIFFLKNPDMNCKHVFKNYQYSFIMNYFSFEQSSLCWRMQFPSLHLISMVLPQLVDEAYIIHTYYVGVIIPYIIYDIITPIYVCIYISKLQISFKMGHVWLPLLELIISWYHALQSRLRNSFGDWGPKDEIYGCPISNESQWLNLKDRAPGL